MVSAKVRLRRYLEITAASAAVDIAARVLAYWFWSPFFILIAVCAFVSFIFGAAGAIYYGVKFIAARRKSKPDQTSIMTKKCPDCAETILAEAHVCKHCGYRFPDKPNDLPDKPTNVTPPDGDRDDPVEVPSAVCPHCFAQQDVMAGSATYTCWRCKKIVSLV